MRRVAPWLLALLLLAGAGYAGYWFVMAHRLAAGIEPWAAAQRAQGYTLAWDKLGIDGFPTAFRLHFADATVGGTKPVPFEVKGAELVAEARPWDLRRWQVSAPQGARAALAGPAATLAAAALDGAVTLDHVDTRIELTAHDLAGGGAATGLKAKQVTAALTLPAHPPANHQISGIAAAIRLTHLDLPWRMPPFGSDVEALDLAATIKGALPQGRLRQALSAWRDDGGTVELTQGSLRWGALAVTANGTLALDGSLQPIGALTATIEDQNAIVDAAVASGSLRAGDAQMIKIFLGLMAKPGPDGKKRLTVPVSLQNDHVYLGPAQIAALPRFSWE